LPVEPIGPERGKIGADFPQLKMDVRWIAVALSLPMVVAVLAAIPFWRRGVGLYGSIVGTGLIFGAVLGFVLREAVGIEQLMARCNELGQVCPIRPERFTRFAVYGFIGLAQTLVLFVVDFRMVERFRRRQFAPEWRW
jgi:hypothetical protein